MHYYGVLIPWKSYCIHRRSWVGLFATLESGVD